MQARKADERIVRANMHSPERRPVCVPQSLRSEASYPPPPPSVPLPLTNKKNMIGCWDPGPRDWAPLEAGHTPFKRVKSSAKVESGRPSRSPHRGEIGDITGCHLDSRAAMQDKRSMPCRPRDEFAPRERSLFAGTNAKHVQSCQPHMGPGVQGRADARLWSCGERQQFSLHREYVLQVTCCINVFMLLRS